MECPNNTLLGLMKYTCLDTCLDGQFKYNQKCIKKCPSQSPYDFKGACVESCEGYLNNLKCYKQCPHGMFGYAGKCILKCPKEAPFVDYQKCVKFCPYVHDDHFNSMKECPTNTYAHGKQCKNDCPDALPFIKATVSRKECVEKCDNTYLATKGFKCIHRMDCSSFIYDDTWFYINVLPEPIFFAQGVEQFVNHLYPFTL